MYDWHQPFPGVVDVVNSTERYGIQLVKQNEVDSGSRDVCYDVKVGESERCGTIRISSTNRPLDFTIKLTIEEAPRVPDGYIRTTSDPAFIVNIATAAALCMLIDHCRADVITYEEQSLDKRVNHVIRGLGLCEFPETYREMKREPSLYGNKLLSWRAPHRIHKTKRASRPEQRLAIDDYVSLGQTALSADLGATDRILEDFRDELSRRTRNVARVNSAKAQLLVVERLRAMTAGALAGHLLAWMFIDMVRQPFLVFQIPKPWFAPSSSPGTLDALQDQVAYMHKLNALWKSALRNPSIPDLTDHPLDLDIADQRVSLFGFMFLSLQTRLQRIEGNAKYEALINQLIALQGEWLQATAATGEDDDRPPSKPPERLTREQLEEGAVDLVNGVLMDNFKTVLRVHASVPTLLRREGLSELAPTTFDRQLLAIRNPYVIAQLVASHRTLFSEVTGKGIAPKPLDLRQLRIATDPLRLELTHPRMMPQIDSRRGMGICPARSSAERTQSFERAAAMQHNAMRNRLGIPNFTPIEWANTDSIPAHHSAWFPQPLHPRLAVATHGQLLEFVAAMLDPLAWETPRVLSDFDPSATLSAAMDGFHAQWRWLPRPNRDPTFGGGIELQAEQNGQSLTR